MRKLKPSIYDIPLYLDKKHFIMMMGWSFFNFPHNHKEKKDVIDLLIKTIKSPNRKTFANLHNYLKVIDDIFIVMEFYNTIIYYWPKTKFGSNFQTKNIRYEILIQEKNSKLLSNYWLTRWVEIKYFVNPNILLSHFII